MTTRERKKASRLPRARRIEEIEAAARAVFSKRGYDGASISEIAAKAGVVEGTIYKYFENKRDLLLKVVERWYLGMIGDYAAELPGIVGSRNRLRFVIWRHLRSIKDNPDLCRLVFNEVRSGDDYFQNVVYRLNRRYTDVLLQILREGAEQGELRADLPLALVRDMVYGAIEHHVWGYLSGRGDLDVDHTADQLADLLFGGIGQADGPSEDLEPAVARLGQLTDRLEALATGTDSVDRNRTKTHV